MTQLNGHGVNKYMEETTIFKLILGGVTVFCIIIGYASYLFSVYICESTYTDYNPKYHVLVGCMIEYNNKRIPSTNFRVTE